LLLLAALSSAVARQLPAVALSVPTSEADWLPSVNIPKVDPYNDPPSYLQTIQDDMTAWSDAPLPGITPYPFSWGSGPSYLNKTAAWGDPNTFKAYNYLVSWGQCLEPVGGNSESNVRVEAGNMTLWIFSKSQKMWLKIRDTNRLSGRAFRSDFGGQDSWPADLRYAPNGDMQFRAGGQARSPVDGSPLNNTLFHFWMTQWPPYKMLGSDVGGVYITQLLWLVPDDPTKPYNLSRAHYECAVGGTAIVDYTNMVVTHDRCQLPTICPQQDSDIPRHKFVTAKPRQFYFLSRPMLALINKYPPPSVSMSPLPTFTVRQRLALQCPYNPASGGAINVGNSAPYVPYLFGGCTAAGTCDSTGNADAVSALILDSVAAARDSNPSYQCGSWIIGPMTWNSTLNTWTGGPAGPGLTPRPSPASSPTPPPRPPTVRQRLVQVCPYDKAANGMIAVGNGASYNSYLFSGCTQAKSCDSVGAPDAISAIIINFYTEVQMYQPNQQCGSWDLGTIAWNPNTNSWYYNSQI